jgi:hypothetical protein
LCEEAKYTSEKELKELCVDELAQVGPVGGGKNKEVAKPAA